MEAWWRVEWRGVVSWGGAVRGGGRFEVEAGPEKPGFVDGSPVNTVNRAKDREHWRGTP